MIGLFAVAQFGGAPANFACMTTQLRNRGDVAGRVGAGEVGREALRQLSGRGLDPSQIQPDETPPMGVAQARVDGEGPPEFAITDRIVRDYLTRSCALRMRAELLKLRRRLAAMMIYVRQDDLRETSSKRRGVLFLFA